MFEFLWLVIACFNLLLSKSTKIFNNKAQKEALGSVFHLKYKQHQKTIIEIK